MCQQVFSQEEIQKALYKNTQSETTKISSEA